MPKYALPEAEPKLSADERSIANVLKFCRTLDSADNKLKSFKREASERPWRWGVYDGWTSRPSTLGGLCPENCPTDPKIKWEYDTGYQLGRKLAAVVESESEE